MMISLLTNTKIQLLIIIILTVGVYANTLRNAFVWDDNTFVKWPLIHSFVNFDEFLRGALPSSHLGDYRPLKGIILALNYQLFGLNPLGYHIQAILIHLGATLMVYVVTKTLIDQYVIGTEVQRDRVYTVYKETKERVPISTLYTLSLSNFVPFFTALLFGVHPVHTEAITFITSSSDIIGIIFFFASFYFYIKASNQHRNRKKMMIASLLLAFLAFVAYEVTLVLPLILILTDLLLFRRGTEGQRYSEQKVYTGTKHSPPLSSLYTLSLGHFVSSYLPYFALIGIYALIRFGILKVYESNQWVAGNFYLTTISMTKAFLKYIEVTIFPLNLSVNHKISEGVLALTYVDYNPTAFMAQRIGDVRVIGGIIGIAGLLIMALFLYRKLPIVTFCILWFFVTMAPFSNIIPLNNLMTERYLYLASYGWCLLVAYGSVRFMRVRSVGIIKVHEGKLGAVGVVAFVLLLTFYSVRTIVRNFDWKDPYSLWSKTLEQTDLQSTLALNNLANAIKDQGRVDEAIELYKKAEAQNTLRITQVMMNLGEAYLDLGKPELAQEALLKAVEYDSGNFKAYYFLGQAYYNQGKIDDAIGVYEKSIVISPQFFDSYINLGSIWARKGDFEKAVFLYKKAQVIDPKNLLTYANLANVYEKQGILDLAIEELKKALAIAPNNKDLLKRLQDLSVKSRFKTDSTD